MTAVNTFGADGLIARNAVFYQFDAQGNPVQRLDGAGQVLSIQLSTAAGDPQTALYRPTSTRGERAHLPCLAGWRSLHLSCEARRFHRGWGRRYRNAKKGDPEAAPVSA